MKSAWLAVCVSAAVTILVVTQARPDEPANSPAPAADPMSGKKPGDVRDDNALKMKLVWCPAGFFKMENVEVITEPAADKLDELPDNDDVDVDVDPKDKPKPGRTEKITPVKVILSKGYWLGKYEVTQSEWKQVRNTEPWKGQDLTKVGEDFPATFIDWNDATEFCRKLTIQEPPGRSIVSRLGIYAADRSPMGTRLPGARTKTKFWLWG